ncbi:hypothetical protein BKA70DRAFT_1414014 [Coprinopsis sp. MPI-PUGE-AT-0042]|nr:hypothetical protein BKA70DRAFT_1414014 [Coprinopsis sp. MPI-PUGE-AT-0042]
MARITSKLIANAQGGDVSSLERLTNSITGNNFVLSALEAFLIHFDPSELHNSRKRADLPRAELIWKAVEGINICARSCDRTLELKHSAVERLLAKFNDIVSCVSHLSEGDSWRAFSMFSSLVVLDPGLESSIFSSHRLCEMFLMAWNTTSHLNSKTAEELGSLVSFFSQASKYDDGSLLIEVVSSSLKQLKSFSMGAMEIANDLLLLSRKQPSSNWDNILSVMGAHMQGIKIKANASTTKFNPSDLQSALITTLSMLDHPNRMADAVEAGLFPVIVDTIVRGPAGVKHRSMLVQTILSRVQGFSSFPKFVKAIHPAMEKAMAKAKASRLRENEDLRKLWNIMPLIAQRRQLLYTFCINEAGATAISTQCDSDSHNYGTGDDPGLLPRACSDCHSVVYCGDLCQTDDWHARHRDECAIMRASYINRKRRGVKYSHGARTFHKDICVQPFLLQHRRADEQRRRLYRNRPPQDFIAIYDTTGQQDTGKGYHLIPFEQYLASRLPGDCPAIDARCDHLIQDFRRTRNTNVVLMEMRSLWSGENQFALMLELEPEGPVDCLIRRIVARVINNEIE